MSAVRGKQQDTCLARIQSDGEMNSKRETSEPKTNKVLNYIEPCIISGNFSQN